MSLSQIVSQLIINPKPLFLIDLFGALLSAFLLGVVWVSWKEWLGLSPTVLYYLASIPCFFALFDWYAYQQKPSADRINLQIIAALNVLYCFASITVCAFHVEQLTGLGWFYFAGEVVLVLLLAALELTVAKYLHGAH